VPQRTLGRLDGRGRRVVVQHMSGDLVRGRRILSGGELVGGIADEACGPHRRPPTQPAEDLADRFDRFDLDLHGQLQPAHRST
jgi:hypothetical protein